MMAQKAVIIGAGGIGVALADKWQQSGHYDVHVVSRDTSINSSWQGWRSDYSDESLAEISAGIAAAPGEVSRLVITNGVLQGDGFRPERALRQLSRTAMAHVLEINTVLPMIVLAAFESQLRNVSRPRVAVLSARVGSIGDNRLGGWYSYRASKSALNMMLQCAAIELHRVNRSLKLIAFHPGTTDTPLSKPFQRGVPADKLFTPKFVADQLSTILDTIEPDGRLSYLDWAGEPIPW
jgi:NAD(P)-dependent dehydrogenase (short-subunit alcohol dehydrogenase family)